MKSRLIVIFFLLLFLLIGIYLVKNGNSPENKVPSPLPNNSKDAVDLKGKDADKKSDAASEPENSEIRLSPERVKATTSQQDDLEKQSMSIKHKNRDITLAPNVLIRPGEGVMIDNSNDEDYIKIKRDNTYRSKEYKVLLEKKF
ncbi:hypothetical protein [Dendrosporobacter sp. 1207_IL3150]|uniref:hypothetical protein n=1 Tax=Dendrosporobacter sp. 1207_IL3150 TaxID=3084054 RepID=UPI002FD9E0BC